MMSGTAAALTLAHFAMTSTLTFLHFNRREKEPLGATFITVAAVLGTLVNVVLWWHLPPSDGGIALAIILLATVIYGLAIRASYKQGFWRAFSLRTPSDVVDSGIYRYVRHPFYVSYMLYWIAWCALNSCHVASLLIAALMICVYVVAAIKEERVLTSSFGERYAIYSDQTRMFCPWIF